MAENDNNVFMIMYSDAGLEYLEDVSMYAGKEAQDLVFAKQLAGEECKEVEYISRRMQYLSMRSRVNGHRNCRPYVLRTSPSITAEDLERLFNANPEAAKKLISETGSRIA